MVYVDNFFETGGGNFGRMKMSHMIADTREELLAMADKIGVARKWVQEKDTCPIHYRELAAKTAARKAEY